MTMPLADLIPAIRFVRQRTRLQLARPRAETHGATQFFHPTQLAQLVNDAVRRCRIELAGVGLLQPAHMTGKFNARRLHAQTDPEEWHLVFARVLNAFQHAFDTALAKTARHQDSIHMRSEERRVGKECRSRW